MQKQAIKQASRQAGKQRKSEKFPPERTGGSYTNKLNEVSHKYKGMLCSNLSTENPRDMAGIALRVTQWESAYFVRLNSPQPVSGRWAAHASLQRMGRCKEQSRRLDG